jgi:galactonate dehydratase
MSPVIARRRRTRLTGIIAAQVAAAAPANTGRLDITALRLFPIREPVSGRSYVVLRVTTRSGLTGFGECFQATAAELQKVERAWIGRPATSYVTLNGPSPLSGAMDVALLDLVGKACKAPVYRVLGGPTRNKVRALAALDGSTNAELTASLEKAASAGYRAFRVPTPDPASRNQGRAYQLAVRARLQELQDRGGARADFVIDGGGLLTPGDASSVATTVQSMHPLWFDEPCPVSNLQTIRKISEESVVPLGFGRTIASPAIFQDLLREGLIDVVRPDISREGITWSRRIAALAEPYYIAVAPHHEGGPIATAAALNLAATLPNFFIQHIPFPAAEEDRRMRAELAGATLEKINDGFAALPTASGLGITVNEAALEKYHAA